MSDIADFDRLLQDVEAWLRRDHRIAYRILKRRFGLDDDDIEDVKADLIHAKRIAADEDGKVLVLRETREPAQRAERRQLTVMFCDIVGSTKLADRLDPEDFRELLRRYQQACGTVIDEAHGHIAQYLGDGLLVYFGYPIAYEDAAVRAVSCGLEIIHAVSDITTEDGEPLQVRIGIHTGTVVIGDVGGGANREQLAHGDTPNIAARIEGCAGPNELLISGTTLRLLHDAFDFESRGETALRGVTTPIALYAIQRSRDVRSRYIAMQQAKATPFAGRERELKRLRDAWNVAKHGGHAKYFIHAEAGIGKSRLVQEIREIVRADGGTPITVVCSPLHSDTALYPLIELIHRVLRVRLDDANEFKLDRLRAALSELRFPGPDTEDILAALLSLKREFGEDYENLEPAQRRQRTFDAILDWMSEVAKRNPVLLVFEDLQAADPSTLDLIEQGLDRFEETPTLMLLVARDEFKPGWGRRGDIVDMHLRRLDRAGIEAIISGTCGGCELPPELIAQIEEKSDGVPLYAEEFTKMVLESDLLEKRDGRYRLAREVANLAIPSSLQDSLMARLDRLHDGKNVAQWGAAIGREFSYEIIKALVAGDVADNGLRELLELGVIYKRKRTLQTTFIFKHALIQDAAYQSLLRSERREYHARIANVLTQSCGTGVEEQPEVVARHLALAERYEEAIEYWLAAGKVAGERAANKDGLAHYDKGIDLLQRLPAGRERDELELRLQMARGPLLMPLKGNGSEPVRETFARALELSQALDATAERFPILFGLRSCYLARGNIATAHDLSLELMRSAEQTQDPGQLLEAHTGLANTYFFRGDFAEVECEAEAGMRIYDVQLFRHHAHIYGTDPGMLCLSRLAIAAWHRARPDRGRGYLVAMLQLVEEIGHLFSLASALNLGALLRVWRGEPALAYDLADRCVELSETHGYRFTLVWSRMLRGQSMFDLGRRDEGIRELEAGFDARHGLSAKLMEPWFITMIAGAKIRYGQRAEAYALLDAGFDNVAETGAAYAVPTLHCLKGEMLAIEPALARGGDNAADSFHAAVALARRHGSRALELRALVGLAELERDGPGFADALEHVRECMTHFTPGEDSRDLAPATALMEAFASVGDTA